MEESGLEQAGERWREGFENKGQVATP